MPALLAPVCKVYAQNLTSYPARKYNFFSVHFFKVFWFLQLRPRPCYWTQFSRCLQFLRFRLREAFSSFLLFSKVSRSVGLDAMITGTSCLRPLKIGMRDQCVRACLCMSVNEGGHRRACSKASARKGSMPEYIGRNLPRLQAITIPRLCCQISCHFSRLGHAGPARNHKSAQKSGNISWEGRCANLTKSMPEPTYATDEFCGTPRVGTRL